MAFVLQQDFSPCVEAARTLVTDAVFGSSHLVRKQIVTAES